MTTAATTTQPAHRAAPPVHHAPVELPADPAPDKHAASADHAALNPDMPPLGEVSTCISVVYRADRFRDGDDVCRYLVELIGTAASATIGNIVRVQVNPSGPATRAS